MARVYYLYVNLLAVCILFHAKLIQFNICRTEGENATAHYECVKKLLKNTFINISIKSKAQNNN